MQSTGILHKALSDLGEIGERAVIAAKVYVDGVAAAGGRHVVEGREERDVLLGVLLCDLRRDDDEEKNMSGSKKECEGSCLRKSLDCYLSDHDDEVEIVRAESAVEERRFVDEKLEVLEGCPRAIHGACV